MNSFFVLTNGAYLETLLLESFKSAGLEINNIGAEAGGQNISLPGLKDINGKPQYVVLYACKPENSALEQYDEADRKIILDKKFSSVYTYSFDYNANKAFDLLHFLIEIIINVVTKNDLTDQVLISEDTNGGMYSFEQFCDLLRKGFLKNK